MVTLLATFSVSAATFEDLANDASRLSKYKPTDVVVKIHPVSGDKLREIYCKGECKVNIKGLERMDDGGQIHVWFDEKLDFINSNKDASIIIHEFVHVLQDMNKGRGETCDEWKSRELEAYRVQNLWLNSKDESLVRIPEMNCI